MHGWRPGIAASASIGREPWSQTSQAPFANDQTHQLRVPQLQESQDSFATYNLYTHTSAFRQHRSFIHHLNHPPRKILAPVPARPTIPPNAYTTIRLSYVTVSTTNIHALSTTGAPPDSSLVLLNINNSGPFALSERLGRIARCYSTVSPRKRNYWWSLWDS